MEDKKSKSKETVDIKKIIGTFLAGDRYTDGERYEKSINNIYVKLKPIWLQECKDAIWLLKDEYVREVAEILYLDDQMGGELDPTTLSTSKQNLLGWKQVQAVVDKYRAMNYSLVDEDTTKAILSSIIRNKNAKDADRLKAIEMYNELYSSSDIEGINFIDDISKKTSEGDAD